jgi:hypothetical protein
MSFPSAISRESAGVHAQKIACLFAAVMMVFLVSLPLFSQANQGAIQGAVLDQSGGAVAGAMVTVIDVARGASRVLTTDSAGAYVATNLIPGTYTVRGEARGFQVLEHANVLVEVGQNVRVDLVLQPGAQTQTVTVTSEVPQINTTDATLGGAVSNEEINSLPLNGRNVERLLQLRPGVVNLPGAGTGNNQSTNGRRYSNELLMLDGIVGLPASSGSSILNTVYRGGDSSSLVPIDAIQEFNVQENPKAEFGWRDGSTTNIGVKSGTNTIHGTAYAFGRDSAATDARNAFATAVTPATLQQFGATAGGRIIKDKLFWFASFEGLRTYLGDVSSLQMPTAVAMPSFVGSKSGCVALAAGNCSQSIVDECNDLKAQNLAISSLSATLAGLNTSTCAVTPANNSPTGENVFPYLNSPTSDTFTPPLTTVAPLNNGLFKGDYNLSSHNHINGLIYISHSDQSTIGATVVLPQWALLIVNDARQYSGTWAWTPNSTWVNEFRMGYVRMANVTFMGDSTLFPLNPWPNGYNMNTGVTPAANPLSGGFPDITINSFSGVLGAPSSGGSRKPEGDVDVTNSVSYLHGKHAFKFGFEFIEMIDGGYSVRGANGAVTFNDLRSFLQGNPLKGSILLGSPASEDQEGRARMYATYAQDDWRLTPRITLNLGLRWEYIGRPWELENNLGNFNPNVDPNTTPAVQQAGPGAALPAIVHADYLDFSPRVGLAWDVRGNGKTVVRAAYNLLRSPPEVATLFPPQNPFGANFPTVGPAPGVDTSGTKINSLSSETLAFSYPGTGYFWNTSGPTFPTAAQTIYNGVTYSGITCLPANATTTINGVDVPNSGTPCPVTAIDLNLRNPYSGNWNVDLQRAITNNLTVDVAYVGNHGYNEIANVNSNSPAVGVGWNTPDASLGGMSPAAYCAASSIDTPAYDHCGVTGSSAQKKPVNTALAANEVGPYATKFPYLSQIPTAVNGDWSNYNALQITLQARSYHGLSFLSGYAYSLAKGMVAQNTQGSSNPVATSSSNLGLQYGYLANDVRHRFTFAPTYAVPGMKSPGQMLQGWSLSALLTLQSAFPWTANDITTTDWLGTGNDVSAQTQGGTYQYWNYSGTTGAFNNTGSTPIPCYGIYSSCVSTLAAAPAAIQTACQNAATAPYTGNAQLTSLALAALANGACYTQKGGFLTPPAFGTLGNAGTGFFRATPYYNVDFSVAKIWKFKERYSAQFRVEFFNLFNRVDFVAPGTNPTKSSFGSSISTPDAANPVLGSGGPRHIQFGLKLAF